MIELHGTYSLDDLTRLHHFQIWYRGWWLYPIVALILVVLAVKSPAPDLATRIVNSIPFLLLLLAYTIFYVIVPFVGSWNQFRKQTYLQDPVVFVFTPKAMSMTGVGISSTTAWNRVIKVRETKSLFILYQGPGSAEMVPKRFFEGPEEIHRWLQLVASRVDPKLIEKPNFIGRWC